MKAGFGIARARRKGAFAAVLNFPDSPPLRGFRMSGLRRYILASVAVGSAPS